MDTAADRAASGIRALIVSREYEAGDRLPAERDLAEQLGLSRPALREGIRRLRSGGVLESRRGSGTYVSHIDLAGVYDIRARLEPLAAERAARLRSDAELEEMRVKIDLMRDSIDEPEAFNRADAEFHGLVSEASRSPVLLSTLERLGELALLSRAVLASDDGVLVSAFADVERVFRAVERQHPKRAANAMERHIMNLRAEYAEAIDGSGAKRRSRVANRR
ncbi:MAG TPA: FCD domain-containing protein [Thermoleophilaceae bacterium]|nr:FCD domain-containing protein [Thermoleophilaceae bacterium]